MEMGTRFGILAHQLYPGATLIDVDYRNLDQALLDTEATINSGASAVLEACFVYDHFRVVSDVVERGIKGSEYLIATLPPTSLWSYLLHPCSREPVCYSFNCALNINQPYRHLSTSR